MWNEKHVFLSKHAFSCVAVFKNCNGEPCLNAAPQTYCLSDTDQDDDSWDKLDYEVFHEDWMTFDIPWLEEEVVETSLLLSQAAYSQFWGFKQLDACNKQSLDKNYLPTTFCCF